MADIRSLTIQDIAGAKKLSDAEGWNQTALDWKLLITAPGNVGLAYTSGNKLIATATAMVYGNDLAWIGMVLVHRHHRGMGISKQLLTALLDRLKSCRSVKLDATPAGQPVYQRFGFKNEGLICRMISEAVSIPSIHHSNKDSAGSVDVAAVSELIEYDRQVTGIDRKILMDYLFTRYPKSSVVLKEHNVIRGFAMGRAGEKFHQAGPLIAETPEDARKLLAAVLHNNIGNAMVVDVPEDKEDFIQWLKDAGFSMQRRYVRMSLNDVPVFNMSEKYFLIGGPEFG